MNTAFYSKLYWMANNDDSWYYKSIALGSVGSVLPLRSKGYMARVIVERGGIDECIFDSLEEAKAWVEMTYRMNR